MPTPGAWQQRAQLVRREGSQAIVEATKERWFTEGFRREAPGRVQHIAETFIGIDREGYAAACEAISRMDLRPSLTSVKANTLIIAGCEDPATPLAMAEELKIGIADARLAVLSPAAHLLAVERPSETVELLRRIVGEHAILC